MTTEDPFQGLDPAKMKAVIHAMRALLDKAELMGRVEEGDEIVGWIVRTTDLDFDGCDHYGVYPTLDEARRSADKIQERLRRIVLRNEKGYAVEVIPLRKPWGTE